ncbi:MAG: T9SS type A sorting domain-containing protein [Paludibacteraceae bacterium]|nr:T9SS type A sorting domain-containing protein [Paludibacteraceae bacterium]
MKKTYLFWYLVILLGAISGVSAQVAPDNASLVHQWTFDDGTANDVVGGLNGVLKDGATVKNKALNLTTGGFVELDAAELAINTYSELTVEGWYTSLAGANNSFHMLYYFGGQNGTSGVNYTCITPARGNNVSRAMISVSGFGNENGVDGPELDDGLLHHMVCVIDAYTLTFYIDGVMQNFIDIQGTEMLAGLGNTLAYFGKGGFTNDPTFKANIHKMSIYNAALTADNVSYLFSEGPEADALISPSQSSVAFDQRHYAQVLTVSGIALTEQITITTPEHIYAEPSTLPANATNVEFTLMYDESGEPVDGDIILLSGTTEARIAVKAVSDADCFVALYPELENMITDGGMNDLKNFGGWGDKSVKNIIDHPDFVYCGANTIQIGSEDIRGSLDFPMDNLLTPSTTYRLKLMVKTTARFNLGIERFDGNNKMLVPLNTQGEWQVIDTTFSTGAEFPANPVMYINNWDGDGGQLGMAYVDNWELYVSPDKKIVPTVTGLAFDNSMTFGEFKVTANNLDEEIVITAPAGITVDPAVLPLDASVALLTVTYDGTTAVDGNILLKSGDVEATVKVKSTNDSECFVPLEEGNLVTDPKMNSLSSYSVRSSVSLASIISEPENVYCGAYSMKVGNGKNTDSGFLDLPLAGLVTANSAYKVKLMAKTNGIFNIGIEHIDVYAPNEGKLIVPVNTNNEWQAVEFYFTTGAELPTNPVIYFNNWPGDGATGTVAFVDNWEIYPTTDQVITLSKTAMAFDEEYLFEDMIVNSSNLSSDITITAPAGITVEPATLSAASTSAAVSIYYDGTTAVDGFVTFTSGATEVNVKVKSASNSCFVDDNSSYMNLIPDPFFTSVTNFDGWGTFGVVTINESDSVFCGSRCGKITTRGNFQVPLTGLLYPNTYYQSKIMLRTIGGAFRMGINNHDKAFQGGIDKDYPSDYVDSVDTQGEWEEYVFEFVTGEEVGETPVIFFNNDHQQGKIAYLDNWTLRQKYPTAVNDLNEATSKIFVQNKKIVAEFNAFESSNARITVFNMQGAALADELFAAASGYNKKQINTQLKSGIYIVRLSYNGILEYRKVIL